LEVTVTFDGATLGKPTVAALEAAEDDDDVDVDDDELEELVAVGFAVMVIGVESRPAPWLATWG
jgi:hypothetical protein